MKGADRNQLCPCGSGKKQKRCHPDMRPRESFTVIDCGEPVAIDSVELLSTGEVRWKANGKQVIPAAAWNETSYPRKKGPKVLSRIPADPTQIQMDDRKTLAAYRTILAVDTNTKIIGSERVSIAAVVQAEISGTEVRWAHVDAVELRDASGNPERVAWRLILMGHAGRETPAALIVDSELSALQRINNHEEAVEANFALPSGWSLVYGTADSGRELIPNRLIKECDRRATELLEHITVTNDTQALQNAPASESFKRIRVWRYAG